MNNESLWTEYKSTRAQEVKKQITLNYLNLVHYVIHHSRFVNFNILEPKDYFQFGIEGLNEAIDRFDPDYGTKFETYAIQRIRGKIIDELRKIQIKPRRKPAGEKEEPAFISVSLESSYKQDSEFMLQEVIPDEDAIPDEILEKLEEKEMLFNAIKNLNERDRLILTLYYYEHLSYKEISEVLNITVSRISQIHSKIIKDLKTILEKDYGRHRS